MRAEAVLRLRRIDTHGDWNAFVRRVDDETRHAAVTKGVRVRLQQRHPTPLPVPLATLEAA